MHQFLSLIVSLTSLLTVLTYSSDAYLSDKSPRLPITPRSPREECFVHIINKKHIPLSVLTSIIGYRKACTVKELSLYDTQLKLLTKLYQNVPADVFRMVISYFYFENLFGLQQAHAQTFKRDLPRIKLERPEWHRLCALNNGTFATASRMVPVQIWSAETHKALFTSKKSSNRAMCYMAPSCIVSAHHSKPNRFNVITTHENQYQEKQLTFKRKKERYIDLLFPHSSYVTACDADNTIRLYDIENEKPLTQFVKAHENTIISGFQYAQHCFVTGDMDGYLQGFDTRASGHIFKANIGAAPHRIAPFDHQTLIMGCSMSSALNSFDFRKPDAVGITIQTNFDSVFDLTVLYDKTLVLCTNNIDFGHKEGNYFEPLYVIPCSKTQTNMAISENETIVTTDDDGIISIFKPALKKDLTCGYFKSPAAAALIGLALDNVKNKPKDS